MGLAVPGSAVLYRRMLAVSVILGWTWRVHDEPADLLHACKADTLQLESHLQLIFALVILNIESPKLLALASLEPPSS
jgi:hypothetical protein